MTKFSIIFLLVFPIIIGKPQSSLLTKKNKSKVEKIARKTFDVDAIEISAFDKTVISKNLKGNIFALKSDGNVVGHLALRRVHGCKIGGCEENSDNSAMAVYVSDFDESSYETFDYLMIIDNDQQIVKVQVIDYPGEHGYEVSSKRWLRQFQGYKGDSNLNYGKNVDAISGATISGNSITSDIRKTYREVADLVGLEN